MNTRGIGMARKPVGSAAARGFQAQRKCACGTHTPDGGPCRNAPTSRPRFNANWPSAVPEIATKGRPITRPTPYWPARPPRHARSRCLRGRRRQRRMRCLRVSIVCCATAAHRCRRRCAARWRRASVTISRKCACIPMTARLNRPACSMHTLIRPVRTSCSTTGAWHLPACKDGICWPTNSPMCFSSAPRPRLPCNANRLTMPASMHRPTPASHPRPPWMPARHRRQGRRQPPRSARPRHRRFPPAIPPTTRKPPQMRKPLFLTMRRWRRPSAA